jgi:hypothetical protein
MPEPRVSDRGRARAPGSRRGGEARGAGEGWNREWSRGSGAGVAGRELGEGGVAAQGRPAPTSPLPQMACMRTVEPVLGACTTLPLPT